MNSQRYSWILKLAIVLLLVVEIHSKGCNVKIAGKNTLTNPYPLILSPKLWELAYLYPSRDGNGELHTPTNDSVRLVCPGSRLIVNAPGNHDDLLLRCKKDTTFTTLISTRSESVGKIYCKDHAKFVIQRTRQHCSAGTPYMIGNEITTRQPKEIRRSLLPLIDLCHDEKLAHTIWAHTRIPSSIGWKQTGEVNIDFRKAGFYGDLLMDKLYKIETQQGTVGRIMNDKAHANSLIHKKGAFYFAKGHLIAKADFVYKAQQRGTAYYVNAVPMWQNINQGNWAALERNIRSLAFSRKRDLDVWTGTVGVLRLPCKNCGTREIYLHYANNKDKKVQVPKILYKIVYDRVSHAGMVFLTANNPYITRLGDYEICKNVCPDSKKSKINYLSWKPNVSTKGLSYCCEYATFKRAVQRAPDIEVVNSLV